ncbi:MAG: gluconate 2-dehydrogenase subunit 3 family protein [Chromatiales bacterium]|nr:gluconate 2-dehydrogenase subunit 3 family protein [Chromatiales bacterium]
MTERTACASSDSVLTEAQRLTLHAVLDCIIPPSDDGRLPGASEYDVLGHVRSVAPELLPTLRDELDRLEARARSVHGSGFAALDAADRDGLVAHVRAEDTRFMVGLAAQTVACYYQQDRVLAAIGMPVRPPFPLGYEVVAGDLSLLDPVRARGKIYRDA